MNYYLLKPKESLLEKDGDKYLRFKTAFLIMNFQKVKVKTYRYVLSGRRVPGKTKYYVEYYSILNNKTYQFDSWDFDNNFETKEICAVHFFILVVFDMFKKVFLQRVLKE
jgi:hypothetical protein